MTTIQKPVKRETAVIYRKRPLVIEIHAGYLTLRQKGTRQAVTLDYRAALDLGYKIMARQSAAEKKAKRAR